MNVCTARCVTNVQIIIIIIILLFPMHVHGMMLLFIHAQINNGPIQLF